MILSCKWHSGFRQVASHTICFAAVEKMKTPIHAALLFGSYSLHPSQVFYESVLSRGDQSTRRFIVELLFSTSDLIEPTLKSIVFTILQALSISSQLFLVTYC